MSAVSSVGLISGWRRILEGSAALAIVLAFSTPGTGQGLPVAPPVEIGLLPAALARIAPEMQKRYVDSGRVAGMVMMIARHGKIGYIQALGYSDLENRIPLRADATFRLASIRKPMLAAATMVLVDTGRIRLDDPLSRTLTAEVTENTELYLSSYVAAGL